MNNRIYNEDSKNDVSFFDFLFMSIQHLFANQFFEGFEATRCKARKAENSIIENPVNVSQDFTDVFDILFPPKHLQGLRKFNRSNQRFVNVMTWKKPSCGIEPVFYEIYRDVSLTNLAGTVLAEKELKFRDQVKKRDKKYSYFLVSVDNQGNKSIPIEIVFKGAKIRVKSPNLQALLLKPHLSPLSTGDQVQLQTYAVLADCSVHQVTHLSALDSSDRTIIDIDQKGNAIGIRPGTVTVSAQLGNSTTTQTLTVTDARLVSIDIVPISNINSPTSIYNTAIGSTLFFKALGHYDNGTISDITDSVSWESDSSDVVKIFNNSPILFYEFKPISGSNSGKAHVIVSKNDIKSNSIQIDVFSLDQLEDFLISSIGFSQILSGDTIKFEAIGIFPNGVQIDLNNNSNLMWSSSNEKVLTYKPSFDRSPFTKSSSFVGQSSSLFDVYSNVTAEVKINRITVRSNAIRVTVFPLAILITLKEITVTPQTQTVSLSDSFAIFKAIGTFISPGDRTFIMDVSSQCGWSSSDTTVASSKEKGIFSLGSQGNTTITASLEAFNGLIEGQAELIISP